MLQNTGFEQIMRQIQQQIQGLGVGNSGLVQTGGGSSIDQASLNKLLQDNEQLRAMVEKLLNQGVPVYGGQVSAGGNDTSRSFIPG